MMVTTGDLIRDAQQGDVEAVNELYSRYSSRVLTLVRHRMGPGLRLKEQSSDLMQETLIKLLWELDLFLYQGDRAWVAYLAKRVEQVIRDKVDYWNAAKRNPSRERPISQIGGLGQIGGFGDAASMADCSNLTASGIFNRNENIQRLTRAMDQLRSEDEESWSLVWSLRIDGQPYDKLAKQRGVSSEAIRKRYYRARKALKRYFQEVA